MPVMPLFLWGEGILKLSSYGSKFYLNIDFFSFINLSSPFTGKSNVFSLKKDVLETQMA